MTGSGRGEEGPTALGAALDAAVAGNPREAPLIDALPPPIDRFPPLTNQEDDQEGDRDDKDDDDTPR